jgi:CubicO group peptidase (beta-lactamase class C family)
MHASYRNVTILQLLSHTSGLPALTDDKDLPAFLAALKVSPDLRAQRASVAATYLALAPASKAGEFEYSNLGYIIAGAIVEAKTGKPWEQLLDEQIFKPLGIADAGFGLPGTPGRVDQPQGHNSSANGLVPFDPGNPDGDNPLALGPAGTINITLKDWMLFAQDHLDGIRGRGRLLKSETYRRLHTPVSDVYALGWGVKLGPDGVPLLLTHSGSNGFWLADIRIMPRKNLIVLFVTNAGNEGANLSVREFGEAVRAYFKPFD